MGMGGNMPRFEPPELPGPELDGPPDTTAATKVLTLKDDQARRYAEAYAGYMNDTKAVRDSVRDQLGIMDDKLTAGDNIGAKEWRISSRSGWKSR